jgi:hypothetical protein
VTLIVAPDAFADPTSWNGRAIERGTGNNLSPETPEPFTDAIRELGGTSGGLPSAHRSRRPKETP